MSGHFSCDGESGGGRAEGAGGWGGRSTESFFLYHIQWVFVFYERAYDRREGLFYFYFHQIDTYCTQTICVMFHRDS